MPTSYAIAVFVVGAILLLASILPGRFKLFGGEIPAIRSPPLRVTCVAVGLAFMATSFYVSRMPISPAQSEPSANVASQFSLVCRFHTGPLTGKTIDFSDVPNAIPAAVGAPCRDGLGSAGMAMPPGTAAVPLPLGSVCQYTVGPKSGGWHDFAPLPPAEVGIQCSDGLGSIGVLVALGTGPAK